MRWLWRMLGHERSGLNYTDVLIRAVGKVGFPMCVWVCKVLVHMCVNMHWNNAHQPREPCKKPRSLCVITVFVCVSVCGFFSTWKPGRQKDRWIKGIKGQDWRRLIKAHATISLMNSLTPSAEVKSSFRNPPFLLSASVTSHVICSINVQDPTDFT